RTVTTSKELDLLFSLMFDELLNGSSNVVSKSSDVCSVDAPNQRQQHTTPLNIHTIPAPTCQVQTLEPTVTSFEIINQAETLVQRGLQAQVRMNGVVESRNRTLVEAARAMLSAAKVLLFFWAKAIATACFTQNRSLVIPHHEKTSYHIINERKPSVKFLHIFGSVCYIVRDGENLDKMKEKGDECIFVRYSTQSRAYRVYNKRTRVIMESIHVNFDELPQMTMALEHGNLSPGRNCQENVFHGDKTGTTSNELDLLFSPMFDELLNGSSTVSAADAPNKRQQPTTPLNNHTTPAHTCQTPTITPSVISYENINQAELHAENDEVADDEFINISQPRCKTKGRRRHVMLIR
nr:retrovirus-related Pol polyprotein from transposon TNT 1-94 [Tanacetum cinerariifolium]